MMGGLLNVGKAAAPKLAAGGLLGLGATASDDAEAGVSGIIRNIPDAVAAINKAVQGGAGQRNQIRVLEKIMHDKNFSNYDEMGGYAIKVDGDTAGDYWKGEIQSMADQLRKAGGLTDEADKHLQTWLDDHLGRELGWKAPKPKPPEKRAPKPQAAPNLAFGDLKKMMAGGGAAVAAGGANSAEMPLMGPGFASAFGPVEGGSTPYESGFSETPTLQDLIDERAAKEADEYDPNRPLPVPSGWDIADSVFNTVAMPIAGLQGLVRGAYGLMTGEDVVTAGAEAANMMGSEWKNGGNHMTPGYDDGEGFRRYGEFTEDTLNEAGVPEPVSKGLGLFNQYGPQAVMALKGWF